LGRISSAGPFPPPCSTIAESLTCGATPSVTFSVAWAGARLVELSLAHGAHLVILTRLHSFLCHVGSHYQTSFNLPPPSLPRGFPSPYLASWSPVGTGGREGSFGTPLGSCRRAAATIVTLSGGHSVSSVGIGLIAESWGSFLHHQFEERPRWRPEFVVGVSFPPRTCCASWVTSPPRQISVWRPLSNSRVGGFHFARFLGVICSSGSRLARRR
jgi:hypothetical protein